MTSIGVNGTCMFSFSGVNLTNGTSYWVLPQTDMPWYFGSSAPTGQNSSGYTFANTLENIDGGG